MAANARPCFVGDLEKQETESAVLDGSWPTSPSAPLSNDKVMPADEAAADVFS